MDELVPSSVVGLPTHLLALHAVVVLVPLASVVVLLAAVNQRFRQWARWLPPVLALGALVLTPVTTASGQDFQRQLVATGVQDPLIAEHAALGRLLIWWVVPLFLVAVATYLVHRGGTGRGHSGDGVRGTAPRWLVLLLAVAGVVVPVGATVQTVLAGHSGSKAVWGHLSD